MEQQWHDILLHNDAGDAGFHKGAPLLLEALQIVSDVQSIAAATRLGLHLRDAEHGSAADRLGSTFTDQNVYQEHATHAATAAPVLEGLAKLFSGAIKGCSGATLKADEVDASPRAGAPVTPSSTSVVAVAELEGLLLPAAVWAAGGDASSPSSASDGIPLAAELRNHPLFSYAAFLERLKRLSGLMSHGEVFSACEPRVKVLQSRFNLYRAYNGGREDEYHPIFGGGDIKRAPKCDLRRVESCVSAASVVRFVEELRHHQPQYTLYAEEVVEDGVAAAYAGSAPATEVVVGVGAGARGDVERPPATEAAAAAAAPATPAGISVEEAMRRFFGTTVPQSERVLTEEGLCLRPSYAADSADRWLSLQQLADSGDSHRAEHAGRLLRHLLSTSGGADGEGDLLAQLLRPILKRVLTSGTTLDRLELELTVSGTHAAELPRLARWCVRSGLLGTCPGLYFRLHVVQDAYAADGAATAAPPPQRRSGNGILSSSSSAAAAAAAVPSAHPSTPRLYFGDVLHNVFSPIWAALLSAAAGDAAATAAPADVADMQALLRRTTGFSVTLTHAAAVQEMPSHGDPSRQFPLPTGAAGAAASPAPPDAFFVYHVWRNVQLLNAFLLAAPPATPGAFTFTLHGGANSRALFGESVLGLLLADAVVNPTTVFEWSPLTYLYMLTQRHVVLTPSRNRCSSAAVKHTLSTTAMPLAVQAGLHVSVATLDPLFYDTTNDALSEEMMELTKQRGLANADVTEMCLRSLEAGSGCLSWAERRHLFGYAWPHAQARYNQFSATQVSSLRLHHRACALEHELDVLFAAVRTSAAVSCDARREARLRAVLFLPPAADESGIVGLTAAAYRRTPSASTRALLREHDPALLQRLSGYHAHESLMQYPRILISGPDRAGPSSAAKRLMAAMATREAYQQFVLRPDDVHRMPVCDTYGSPEGCALVWHDGVLNLSRKQAGEEGGEVTRDARARPFAATASDAAAAAARPSLPTWAQFQQDIRTLRRLASADPTVAKYSSKRLDMLESKYKLHAALTNDDEESYTIVAPDTAGAAAVAAELQQNADVSDEPRAAQTALATPDRRRVVQPIRGDAHNCVKVDVHCHMASGMTAKSLLQFMQNKICDHPDDVVGVDSKTGTPITLVQFFHEVFGEQQQQQQRLASSLIKSTQSHAGAGGDEALGPAANARAALVSRLLAEMPIAALQVHAGKATFHRFDRFNHRFSPMGMTSLRSLFLKTDNFMQGRYFAELIRGAFKQNELEGGTFTENRLSIYGRSWGEWDRLSRWFVVHGVSHRTNSWMIQVPRLFHLYQRSGQLRSFQEMLRNIFEPLWQASMHPDKHPYLHFFLSHVSGFDSVDDESDREPDQTIDTPPAQWTSPANPPFAYYMFYMWANITTLNRYRAARGFSTFQFRPHAGESGDPDHMADVFVLADGIGHGINLDKRPVLQYLYYLAQIPLAVVPMSNNALFCRYKDHPLPSFLYRGLNVAIGTDGPLIFHRTEQPLLEEYGTAEALWNLSAADICELAANSVRGCGFPVARKKAWLGPLYYLRSVAGNDVGRSHVPQTRCAFRYEAYMEEVTYLQSRAAREMSCRAIRTPLEEEVDIMDAVGISRGELLKRRWSGAPIVEKRRGGGGVPQPSAEARPPRIGTTFDASHV